MVDRLSTYMYVQSFANPIDFTVSLPMYRLANLPVKFGIDNVVIY